MEFIDELMCFGLTRQESVIYKRLLQAGELTGYEASKQTGISRSNTYGALAGLVEKGAAYMIEGESTKYTPESVEEFCGNKLRYLEQIKGDIVRHAPAVRQKTEGYITIKGEKHIFNKMRSMLNEAKERVYLEAFGQNLSIMDECLPKLLEKNIKVVIISDRIWKPSLVKVYIRKEPVSKSRIGLITDTERVLTGEADGSGESTCLYSGNKNLVSVFRDMLSNEIKLIELQEE